MKVFLAHSKGTTDLEIQHLTGAIVRWYAKRGEEVEVIPGVDDFNTNIASDGTFDAWAKAVPHRRDTFTGLRLYGAAIVPGREMGKATALIAQECLARGTPVLSLEWTGQEDDNGNSVAELFPAAAVLEVDARDYFRGWALSLTF